MIDAELSAPRAVVRLALVSEGVLAALALGFGWFLARPPLEQIGWTLGAVAQGLLATVPMVVGLLLVTRYPRGPFRRLKRLSEEFLVPLFCGCTVGQLAVISALAGFGEELFFRGLLQAGIGEWTGLAWPGLVVASVLFALVHLVTPFYALLAGLIGLYFGWLLLATGNLLPAVVAHAAYDFVALVYLTRWRNEKASQSSPDLSGDDRD